MKTGKERISLLPLNDITNLGSFAQRAQQEAEAAGRRLPPPLRLHIGEPDFRTPEHICQAAIEILQTQPLTYGPPAGWPWLRELLAEKIARVNGYRVGPENTAVTIGGTGALLSALLATVGPGDEVLIPDPHWPQYTMQMATCGATGMRAGYQHRRDLAVTILREHGRYVYTPHGSFYILVDARWPDGRPRAGRVLARDLLRERNVTVAPGSGFGAVAENYVRVSLAGAEDEIAQGLHELCLFADRAIENRCD